MGKNTVCNVAGAIASFGVNQFAKSRGLSLMPQGVGQAIEWDPGLLVKNELSGQCKGEDPDQSIFSLNLSSLTDETQKYLIDRMTAVSNKAMFGQASEGFELPEFDLTKDLTYISLPGYLSALLWVDPSKPGIEKIQAVGLKWRLVE